MRDTHHGIYADPGEDQPIETARYHFRAILAIYGRDGQITLDEMREFQQFNADMMALASQRAAAPEMMPDDSATSEFGESAESEPVQSAPDGTTPLY